MSEVKGAYSDEFSAEPYLKRTSQDAKQGRTLPTEPSKADCNNAEGSQSVRGFGQRSKSRVTHWLAACRLRPIHDTEVAKKCAVGEINLSQEEEQSGNGVNIEGLSVQDAVCLGMDFMIKGQDCSLL